MNDLLQFTQTLMRHPSLVAEVALLVAILLGAGRALGLPLLFWHERWGAQLFAGLSATLLVGEILLVTYLADEPQRAATQPATIDLPRFLELGGRAWVVIVLLAGGYRWLCGTVGSSSGVAPGFRRMAGEKLGELVAAEPPVWPFVAGCLIATCCIVLLTGLGRLLEPWVAPVLKAALFGSRVADPTLHLAALLTFVLLIAAFFTAPVTTPAVEICALLGLATGAYGFVGYWLQSSGVAIILAAGLLVVAGLRPRRLRILALESWYERPAPYPPSAAVGPAAGSKLLRFNDGWSDSGGRRPLILVCASGGGIRAATWTAAILTKLGDDAGFPRAVRLITGASGGMLGAAAWVARLHASGTPADLVAAVAGDALSPLAHRLVFRDVPFAFLPVPNADNRGQAMEETWIRNTERTLEVCLGSLREKEAQGELPSLVFSPMIVEDGRRLIISNLDLSTITTNQVRWLERSTLDTASLSAFSAEDLLPGVLERLPLSTAARLSASFPYVSPAAVLPTQPSRRVVDAGYYDNYGLSLACEWLRECLTRERAWLERNVSRVLLLQIRDNVSQLSVDGEVTGDSPPERRTSARSSGAAARGFEWLTSPISGVLSARESVMLFRNDAALEAATQLFDREIHPGFLTTTIFEFKGEASLSWYLTRAEYDGIRDQAASADIGAKLQRVLQWLST